MAQAAVISTAGQVEYLDTAPVSINGGSLDSNTTSYMFPELQNVLLNQPLAVDLTALAVPITYTVESQLPQPQPKVPAGTRVNSYYLHTEPVVRSSRKYFYTGTASFDSPILGVVIQSATLDATDVVKSPSTTYETTAQGRPNAFRGLEFAAGDDAITIDNDHTITWKFRASSDVDDIRFITQATTQGRTSPGSGPFVAPGYRFVASDGGVFDFGRRFYGSTGGEQLNQQIVGGASTPSSDGYWLVAKDGGIFAYGDATFYGSTGGRVLNQPIVGMASTPSGGGYRLFASDGGVFDFGNAPFYGALGSLKLNKPIVGGASDDLTDGYWQVASDGGVFAFHAPFFGSTGHLVLNQPIVGMAITPTGQGYWLVAFDGGVFAFGDAKFFGSTGGLRLNQPVVGIIASPDGQGYWLVAKDGGVFSFGDARFLGSTGGQVLNKPIVAGF